MSATPGGDPRREPFVAPRNAGYGSGCYRRAIRLVQHGANRVEASLEDDAHAFALSLGHDGTRVTAIEGRAVRFPLSTCSGAVEPLRALQGVALAAPRAEIHAQANPRANCTHLHDLALIAIGHAARGDTACQYDILIPDADAQGRTRATLARDGALLLEWELEHGVIGSPARYAGQAVLGGFTSWARTALDAAELEHALMLQRGFFVALSRLYDMDANTDPRAANHPMPPGVCYSYSPGRVEHALSIRGSRRDFSDAPKELLRWA